MSQLEVLQGQPIRPLRRAEFNQLAELGAFQEERVELLYGQLVPMSPVGAPHCTALERLNELFVVKLVGRMRIRIQMPIAASDESQPEPDLAIAPLSDGQGDHPAHPVLVIEVAHTSLAMDRRVKAKLYAECGVPEYWIVNLVDQVVEVHRDPVSGAYQSCRVFHPGEVVAPARLSDIEVPVDLLMRG
ncbi:MAG: Uma2 family endonuclease [Polyangiaceae bacterium]